MLRMTKQADYGIVLMTQMAGDPDARSTASELSEQTQIPLPMVSKILKLLSKNGLLNSHRGVKGGYALARAPEHITVARDCRNLGARRLERCAARIITTVDQRRPGQCQHLGRQRHAQLAVEHDPQRLPAEQIDGFVANGQ